jgi:hypothetical protein
MPHLFYIIAWEFNLFKIYSIINKKSFGTAWINIILFIIINVLLMCRCHLVGYPIPININIWYNFGFLLGIIIVFQILTGILLSLYYSSDILF